MTEPKMISTAKIRPLAKSLNPRKSAPRNLEDLRESIRAQGILQPLLLRKKPSGKFEYEAVIGNRRLLAARELGLKEVPATVRDSMDDNEARIVNLVEQIQREDLTPLDEAGMLSELLEKLGGDRAAAITDLAAQLGRAVSYVSRRSNLLSLHPKILDGSLKGKHEIERWPVALLEGLATLTGDQQLEIVQGYWDGPPNPTEFAAHLREYTGRLTLAPWDLEDATLVAKAGACVGCTKNSCNAPGLFDDVVTENPIDSAVCLDRECWHEKGQAHVLQVVAAAEEKDGSNLLLVHSRAKHTKDAGDVSPPSLVQPLSWNEKPAKGAPSVLDVNKWEPAKKSDKGAQRALVVSGGRTGKTIWVKTKGAKGKAAKPTPATSTKGSKGAAAAPKEKPDQEKKRLEETLKDRRAAWRIDHVRQQIADAISFHRRGIVERLVSAYGTDGEYLTPSAGAARAKAFRASDASAHAWTLIKGRICKALTKNAHARKEQDAEAAFVWNEILGFNERELERLSKEAVQPSKRLQLLRDPKKKAAPAKPAKKAAKKKATRKTKAKRKAKR